MAHSAIWAFFPNMSLIQSLFCSLAQCSRNTGLPANPWICYLGVHTGTYCLFILELSFLRHMNDFFLSIFMSFSKCLLSDAVPNQPIWNGTTSRSSFSHSMTTVWCIQFTYLFVLGLFLQEPKLHREQVFFLFYSLL